MRTNGRAVADHLESLTPFGHVITASRFEAFYALAARYDNDTNEPTVVPTPISGSSWRVRSTVDLGAVATNVVRFFTSSPCLIVSFLLISVIRLPALLTGLLLQLPLYLVVLGLQWVVIMAKDPVWFAILPMHVVKVVAVAALRRWLLSFFFSNSPNAESEISLSGSLRQPFQFLFIILR